MASEFPQNLQAGLLEMVEALIGIRNQLRIKVDTGETEDSALITAVLNGTTSYQWNGPLKSLSSRADWKLHPSTLGLGVHNLAVRFHQVKLKVLTKGADYVPIAPNPLFVAPPVPHQETTLIRYQMGPEMQFGLEVLYNNAPAKITFDPKGTTNSTLLKIDDQTAEFGFVPGRWNTREANLGLDAKGKTRVGHRSVWQNGKISVTQTVKLVKTGKDLPDTCLVRHQIENRDDKSYKIGIRCLVDTFIADNDGHPFVVTGKKELIITYADFRGIEVPVSVQALQKKDLANPGLVAYLTLKVGGLEPPDRFSITQWPGLANPQKMFPWEIPLEKIGKDSAVVLYWSPRELKPGEWRVVGYSYGLGEVKFAEKDFQPAPKEENIPFSQTSMDSIYKAMKLKNLKLGTDKPYAGETIRITYELANTSSKGLLVPKYKKDVPSRYALGSRQHWVERLGPDAKISSFQGARQGKKYAAGGTLIFVDPVVSKGMVFSFVEKLITKDFPPGNYKYYVEYQRLDQQIIETDILEFELRSKEKKP